MRIVFFFAAVIWILFVINWFIGEGWHGAKKYIVTTPLLMGLPELIIATIISLAQNWTISGKLTGASVEISPNNSDVGQESGKDRDIYD